MENVTFGLLKGIASPHRPGFVYFLCFGGNSPDTKIL